MSKQFSRFFLVLFIFVKNPVKSYVFFNKFMRIFFVIITICIFIEYICVRFSVLTKYNLEML